MPAIQVTGNVEGSIVIGDNNFVVNTNHGTIIYKQAAPQVRLREMYPRPPRLPRGFVGRANLLAVLDERIAGREAVLVHGGAGMGKTSLLKKAAHAEAAQAQMNGVIFLEGIDPEGRLLAWDDLLQMLFDALFESDPHLKVSAASARTYLSNTQPLVVLDGLQLNASALESLTDLFPNAAVVISSERATSGGVFEAIKLKALSADESAQLLVSKAGWAPESADRATIEQICSLLAGVPLALTTVGNLAREFELGPDAALASLREVHTQEQEPLRAAIQRSFWLASRHLGEDELHMLAMAAAAPGMSASRPWLESASPGGEAASQRLENLQLLQANSPRLRIHPEYIPYALEKFDPEPIRENLLRWIMDRLQIQSLDFHFQRAELGTLLGLMHWATANERWQDVIALGRAVDPFLALSGLWSAWQGALEQALAAARSGGDLAAEAWALHELGTRAAGQGETTQAVDLLRRALQLRQRLGDAQGAAFTRHNLEALKPPPGGGGGDARPAPQPTPRAPSGKRLNALLLFLVVFPAFILGTLTGVYYGCRLEIAPVISALAGALQPEDERRAIALLEVSVTPTQGVVSVAGALQPSPTVNQTSTPLPSSTSVPTATSTETAQPTKTQPPPTATTTAMPSETPTPTAETAANSLLLATVLQQSYCRYGPAAAYLPADDLFANDALMLNGRNYSATWLYVQNVKSNRYCWVAASQVQSATDPMTLGVVQTSLPINNEISQPTGVQAARDKNTVAISWNQVHVNLVDARGYLLELNVCQNGLRFTTVVQTDATNYAVQDETTCTGASSGVIYSVSTRGYTTPVKITWP